MFWINHIIEPDHLILAWQSPLPTDRNRRVVGDLYSSEGGVTLKYRVDTDDFRAAENAGFKGFPAFEPKKHLEYRKGVLETFMLRLPPRSRSDFRRYLEKWGLQDAVLSDFALLAYTEAKLPSDGFCIVNPWDGVDGPFEFVTEIAGFRHQRGVDVSSLTLGAEVVLVPEPDNRYDSNAVMVKMNGACIGYINRIQAPAFLKWIKGGLCRAYIQRYDGTSERPLVYLFIEVREEKVRTRERQIAIGALRVAVFLGGEASIAQIKDLVGNFIQLTPADRIASASRPTEQVFMQIIRNIISHRRSAGNIIHDGYADYDDSHTSIRITEAGRAYLRKLDSTETAV